MPCSNSRGRREQEWQASKWSFGRQVAVQSHAKAQTFSGGAFFKVQAPSKRSRSEEQEGQQRTARGRQRRVRRPPAAPPRRRRQSRQRRPPWQPSAAAMPPLPATSLGICCAHLQTEEDIRADRSFKQCLREQMSRGFQTAPPGHSRARNYVEGVWGCLGAPLRAMVASARSSGCATQRGS